MRNLLDIKSINSAQMYKIKTKKLSNFTSPDYKWVSVVSKIIIYFDFFNGIIRNRKCGKRKRKRQFKKKYRRKDNGPSVCYINPKILII